MFHDSWNHCNPKRKRGIAWNGNSFLAYASGYDEFAAHFSRIVKRGLDHGYCPAFRNLLEKVRWSSGRLRAQHTGFLRAQKRVPAS